MQEAIDKLRKYYEAKKQEEWVNKTGQRMFLTGVRMAIHELEKEMPDEFLRKTPDGG